MIRNKYLEELSNDMDFLDTLAQHPSIYRVLLPFLQDHNYVTEEDYWQELVYEEGMEKGDLSILCRRARTFVPLFQRCAMHWDWNVQEKTYPLQDRIHYQFESPVPLRRFCIGIGHYETRTEGKFHMCVLIDLYDRKIAAFSFSRSLEVAMAEMVLGFMREVTMPQEILVHSSRNAVYQKAEYGEILQIYQIIPSMTEPGSRGGIMPVSQFFSQLKRDMKGYIFQDVQDGIDWLTAYLLQYNLAH